MIAADTLITFALAALLLSLSPGPSNLYIMARSLNQGQLAGIAAASGMALGSLLYVIATALGIAAIFVYSPLAYSAVKLAGALYLIYLGVCYLRMPVALTTESNLRPMSMAKIWRQSLLVELTNPKTALFFIAFLPQFVDPDGGRIAVQLTLLGLVYSVIALCCDLLVATLSGRLGRWLSGHPWFVLWQDRLTGLILVALGGTLGYEELAENGG